MEKLIYRWYCGLPKAELKILLKNAGIRVGSKATRAQMAAAYLAA